MANFTGIVNAAAQLGLESLIVKPQRGIFSATREPLLIPQVTIEELHHDDLEITDHPVEQGANITDHAFKHPAEIIVKMGYSNSPSNNNGLVNAAIAFGVAISPNVANVTPVGANIQSGLAGANANQVNQIYQKLLELQANRVLSNVLTGKRTYANMLIKSLSVLNDNKSENALFVTCSFRQIIIVNTQTVLLQNSKQVLPKQTTSTSTEGAKQLKAAPNYKP